MCDTYSVQATEKEIHVIGLMTELAPPESEPSCSPVLELPQVTAALWDLKKLHDHKLF